MRGPGRVAPGPAGLAQPTERAGLVGIADVWVGGRLTPNSPHFHISPESWRPSGGRATGFRENRGENRISCFGTFLGTAGAYSKPSQQRTAEAPAPRPLVTHEPASSVRKAEAQRTGPGGVFHVAGTLQRGWVLGTHDGPRRHRGLGWCSPPPSPATGGERAPPETRADPASAPAAARPDSSRSWVGTRVVTCGLEPRT